MPEYVAAGAVGGAIAVLLVGIIFVLPWLVERDDEIKPRQEPLPRMSVARAHEVMRLYRRRTLEDCAEKRAAFRTLVAAGRIVPDPRVERWVR
ncbi:hypothetical protein IU438_28940 [Nocardia cyriacigeorgica]|uniref:hypothetical protein n=1 Tax=Nocardia cyriacigeorgica TaxID=135487 RepID=UPI001894A187|nr:hypothetical protein [Nocardia cyriacigeorgica]MBF6326752.1 hypothetical protein [Nocardia cyriacigeorgica]MBF6399800.1 hypothetical protein [Nocardia cyriacigeorgica]MBF6405371.1 hypothetical protein [Nocardia cyriacigeorgica]